MKNACRAVAVIVLTLAITVILLVALMPLMQKDPDGVPMVKPAQPGTATRVERLVVFDEEAEEEAPAGVPPKPVFSSVIREVV